jgi:hypothetical protein
MALSENLSVLKTLNPYYAWDVGFRTWWLLAFRKYFLCTTGANFTVIWDIAEKTISANQLDFYKIALVYVMLGKRRLMDHVGETIGTLSPFFIILYHHKYFGWL